MSTTKKKAADPDPSSGYLHLLPAVREGVYHGKGIILTREYDLATAERKKSVTRSRKKLVLCEHCGEVVAPLDHLMFLAKKVGHLLFTNPTLLLARHAELKILEEGRAKEAPHPRGGHLRMLCPNCRREMILKEQW